MLLVPIGPDDNLTQEGLTFHNVYKEPRINLSNLISGLVPIGTQNNIHRFPTLHVCVCSQLFHW